MPSSDTLTLRVGTRGSPLALAQAREVADALAALTDGAIRGEIVSYTTSGDQLTTERLINSGGKGLFTKEIDRALDAAEIDLAVHSLKDVPSRLPAGQTAVAWPRRADPREAFICPTCDHPRALPEGAVVGTASLRREAQTLALRPDVRVVPFRGKVQTRLEKLASGQADATWLAMAGLERLGMTHVGHPIDTADMLPSAGQGTIVVVIRDAVLTDTLGEVFARMTHEPTRRASLAERSFLATLDGSCRTPIAGHLFAEGDRLRLRGEVFSIDGRDAWRAEAEIAADCDDAALIALGRDVAETIRDAAGGSLPAFEDL